MIAPIKRFAQREFHPFESAGETFVYLVPSAAVFQLDDTSKAVLETLDRGPASDDEIVGELSPRFGSESIRATLAALLEVRAIGESTAPPDQVPRVLPQVDFPLTTMVLNVTNKCNLACTYCYEYGEDKIVDTTCDTKPNYMSEETARQSVDFMFEESGTLPMAHLTFFGGETLLNFKVLKKTLAYARQRGEELGKEVDFSLTTNGTLLREEVIEWLAENRVGVTISIDGPKDMQDKMRVFKNGMGSYDHAMPKIKMLLERHKSRPIGARVTLTRQTLDVTRIYNHLRDEIGFWEVGFAPVTTADGRGYAIEDEGFSKMLGQFEDLAADFLQAALENRHHGFSNVKDTIEEIHKGVSKAFPCGAGLGLMGVATDGDVALCHRFAGSDEHKVGSVYDGVDKKRQFEFLGHHHVTNKTDCDTCWARPLCAGGCYHEAHVRYGDTGVANLHYCDWIRSWTNTCLEIYGEIAVKNPEYLHQFDA
ncbi:MAG: quinohemoprotein amine dehydrogenase maturation protein [Longimicrobiales bacterium]